MAAWRDSPIRAVERIDDASEADARVLDHLVRLGCDPSRPRECRYYMILPRELDARRVAHALRGDGWHADCEEEPGHWLVTGTTVTGLTDAGVRETRSRLELLASVHGGEYDGWEAAAD